MLPGSEAGLRLRVGDCSVLTEYDQRADPRRAPGMGESASPTSALRMS
jgi:hypothetical protein